MTDETPVPRITPTDIAQFVRLESCERYLWYRLHSDETREFLRRYRVTEQPLSPLLRARGQVHESAVTEELRARGIEIRDMAEQSADVVIEELRRPLESPRALIQPRLEGSLGPFQASGIADLVRLEPLDGAVRLRIEDAKSSRKDRPEHRIQVAFYAHLLRQMADRAGAGVAEVTGAIWRIPADEDDEQPVPFDLQPYEEALELLVDEAGVVRRVANSTPDAARYHLTYKCDGCLYNAVCMREAADQRSLALIPFISQRDRIVLERNGVADIVTLARVKELPPRESRQRTLNPAPGQEQLVETLNSEWPVGANLDLHVQRARAVARAHQEEIESRSWIQMSGFGSLPSRETYEDLVQIFIDGQHDYLQDRIYALSAVLVGPGEATREVIRLTESPPDEEAEADLIIGWLRDLLVAARAVAGADEATPHVYVFDRYDQKVLLDALRRHIDRLAGVPEFYDILTESAALSQPMFSFLAQEIRERKNLGILCHSLPMAARRLGFDWDFEDTQYHRVFQARIFDNRRTLDDGRWYESAARFNSQIPLEYAYATWDRLPDDEESRALLEPFLVTREQLLGFLRARGHALRHIESTFRPSRYLRKERMRLPRATHTLPTQAPLSRVLVEFLYLEHYAKLQSRLLLYAEPTNRRVASGDSILVEALEDCAGGRCRLRFRFEEAGLDPATAREQMSPEEKDWMVVSPANANLRPWEILRGRMATIDTISDGGLVIDMKSMSLSGEFRYPHNRELPLRAGGRYVLDPMADEFVAERLLDACRNTDHNDFLRWIEAGGGAIHQREVTQEEQDRVQEFLHRLEESPAVLTPTARQGEAICGHLTDPVLLVQGPPGTGKTHTIAWAVLARAYAAARETRPFHVLVSSMTHTAVEVVLRSIIMKLTDLAADPTTSALIEALDGLRLFKETWDPSEGVPEGVTRIGASEFNEALQPPISVIGAVPSGVHRLLKGRGGPVNWEEKRFDLLVIDEASQVSLPAAVLAGASLRPEGQALVVGDHRQMPPILVHEWEDEPRRGVQDSRIYASTFEALRDRDFPQVRLDQSFRLHAMHAAFLEEHVYREDQVGFHSNRDEVLPSVQGLEGHVAAALLPDYPVVIIEHTESESLKRNDAEIAIVAPIIEAAVSELGLDPHHGIGVVVPHRAQRASLRAMFPDLAAANAIDTVERFQGGERDLIIVSATASDPEFVLAEAKFLLNPNRLNVAFSRPRKKLVVVGSTTIFRLMPPDTQTFENALLWKRLRYEFSGETLWEGWVAAVATRVSGRNRLEARP